MASNIANKNMYKNTFFKNLENEDLNLMDNEYADYSLSPKERIEAAEVALEKYEKIGNAIDLGDYWKFSIETKDLIGKGLEQLEFINKCTEKAFNDSMLVIDEEIEKLNKGEGKTYYIEYKDINGNIIKDDIGFEKDQHGEIRYYTRNVNEKGQVDKTYISESEFENRLSTQCRHKVKEQHGIGENLYEITDKDGNKLIITDARDDSAKANSFNDGLASINIYRVGADGSKVQLTAKDLNQIVIDSGISRKDIEKKTTNKIAKTLAQQAWRAPGAMKRSIEQASELTTSTR